ncbi:MAG TPA: hypothetical protein VK524_03205, partial [Polyangiaceae bacterium]|nr:hypothetical protein [Polyangiaceae bacterium]
PWAERPVSVREPDTAGFAKQYEQLLAECERALVPSARAPSDDHEQDQAMAWVREHCELRDVPSYLEQGECNPVCPPAVRIYPCPKYHCPPGTRAELMKVADSWSCKNPSRRARDLDTSSVSLGVQCDELRRRSRPPQHYRVP